MKKLILYVMIGLVFTLADCSKDIATCTKSVSQATLDAVPKAQLATDIARIQAYLTANSITAVEDISGLRYVITKQGTGASPCLESAVTVTYSGRTLKSDGTLNTTTFDKSTSPIAFGLQNLILGWQVGFLKLQAGSTATLYIPSGLAYGTSPAGTIPANSVLVFDVALISFTQP